MHQSVPDKGWEPYSLPRMMIKFAAAKSIEFAVEKDVKILRVHGMGCRLPETSFNAKSLIELDLHNCYLISIDGNNTMFLLATRYDHFKNLKRLIFQRVYLGCRWEWNIEKLFCNMPLIEEIESWDLRVSNVHKLKRIKVHSMGDIGLVMGRRRTVEIVAPSLESFDYLGEGTLNIDGCQNLKRLLLNFSYIDLKRFNSFSNFQFLEFLEIDCCKSMNSEFNISSQSLKHVRLYTPLHTAEVMIDAPNLLLLEYGGNCCNSISFRNPPKQLKVTLSIGRSGEVKGYRPLLTWFLRVRSSWMKLGNRENIYLSLQAHDMQKCFVSIKDSEELPEPEVEHLALFCCDPDQHTEFEGVEIDQSLIARCEAHRRRTYIKSACFKLKWSA